MSTERIERLLRLKRALEQLERAAMRRLDGECAALRDAQEEKQALERAVAATTDRFGLVSMAGVRRLVANGQRIEALEQSIAEQRRKVVSCRLKVRRAEDAVKLLRLELDKRAERLALSELTDRASTQGENSLPQGNPS